MELGSAVCNAPPVGSTVGMPVGSGQITAADGSTVGSIVGSIVGTSVSSPVILPALFVGGVGISVVDEVGVVEVNSEVVVKVGDELLVLTVDITVGVLLVLLFVFDGLERGVILTLIVGIPVAMDTDGPLLEVVVLGGCVAIDVGTEDVGTGEVVWDVGDIAATVGEVVVETGFNVDVVVEVVGLAVGPTEEVRKDGIEVLATEGSVVEKGPTGTVVGLGRESGPG